MPEKTRAYAWATDILKVAGEVTAEVIGTTYNFKVIYGDGEHLQLLGVSKAIFDREFRTAINRFSLEPTDISREQPPDYKPKPFENPHPMTDDELGLPKERNEHFF
jgi:hypothetical protein